MSPVADMIIESAESSPSEEDKGEESNEMYPISAEEREEKSAHESQTEQKENEKETTL